MATQNVVESSEWRWVYVSSVILLLVVSLPLIWAYGVAAPDAHFMGVLVNPIDGAAYQARMYQGWQGSWLLHLPYTPEPHRGVILYTFYLAMGHLARLTNLPIILVFHVVRLLCSAFMLVALYRFVADWTGDVIQRRITWALIVVGAGFGWVALMAGYLSSDMLMLPEGFPLQAILANPHFPLAIGFAALVAHVLFTALLIEQESKPEMNTQTATVAVGTLVLVSIAPFTLVPLAVGFLMVVIWLWRQHRSFPWREIQWGLVVLIFGLPLAAYNMWAISEANPVFHMWMQQNLTPSPPPWDYLTAYGPLLILAGVGLWGSRRSLQAEDMLLLGWLISGMIMLYMPLGLQRRFAMGLIIPLAIYAGRGLWRVIIPRIAARWQPVIIVLVFSLFVPTTVMAIVLPMAGAVSIKLQADDLYFVSEGEWEALSWIEANTPPDALVLASPDLSLFVPTRGRRVVYGHPYETLYAEQRKQAVLDFYTGADCQVVADEGVDYIIVGPDERRLAGSNSICAIEGEPVFVSSDGQVVVYDTVGE